MNRKEAIEMLEESKRQNEIMRDNPNTFWGNIKLLYSLTFMLKPKASMTQSKRLLIKLN